MIRYLKNGIWEEKISVLPPFRRFSVSLLRIVILTFRCFFKNQCMLRASALTFYTLLSLIPIAALAFAVAKGFGYEKLLQDWLMSSMEGKEVVAEKIIVFAQTTLKNARGGLIAGIGSLALFFITIRLLMQVENSMNDIWGVRRGRPLLRKISEYLSLIILCPLAIVVSTGTTVFATAHLTGAVRDLPFLSESMNIFLAYFSQLLPFITTWIVFTFLYIFIPNTKVHFLPALLGGFVGGLVYFAVQTLYLAAQITVTRYNAIYGSFAALPLFLIWMQTGWTIILFGSQLAFAVQNVQTYEGTTLDGVPGLARKYIYSIKIARLCAILFEKGLPAPTDVEISEKLEIPVRSTRYVLYELTASGILSRVLRNDNAEVYQPALPINRLTTLSVLQALQMVPADESLDREDVYYRYLRTIWDVPENSKMNLPLTKLELGAHYFHE